MPNTAVTTKAVRVGRSAAHKARIALVAGLIAVGLVLPVLVAGLVTPPAQAATTTSSNSSPIQIVDNSPANPYPSQINVQNLSGNVTDVNVKLNGFTHTFPEDVDVLLVGPKGQKALLMSDVGGGTSAHPVADVNLTLDDEATTFLPDNDQITSGTYKPTQGTSFSGNGDNPVPANFPTPAPAGPYATDLSVFDGTDPNGAWSLFVIDDSPIDAGQFQGGWSLDITTDGPDTQPDTTSPRVESTVPVAGAKGVSPTANVTATFSEDMQASTINGTTFKLFRKGSTTKLAATVSYDATTDTATLDPTNSLKRGATYKAVVTTFAKDLAGNRLDQNPSLSGLQPKRWFFTVSNS